VAARLLIAIRQDTANGILVFVGILAIACSGARVGGEP